MDMDAFELQHARLTSEITSLLKEKEMLVQTAPIDGTIGNVSVQLMELVPPYQTIISVYDENPSIIRAYMNEQAVIPVQVGDKVSVESSNRSYAIEGEIIEIGSRIVSYPKQMISGEQVEMWGKELFVKIPDENNFLNGEKVYVLIDAQ
jgi:HlyD family secretion protein